MAQKRDVVPCYVEVALVDLRHPRQPVQVLDHAALGIVSDAAIFPKADARQFLEWGTGGIAGDLIIEFTAHDKIDRSTLKRHSPVRP